MEIFTAGVEVLKNIVSVIGGGTAITGIITYLLAHSDQNGAQKLIGIGLFCAGAGIAVVAQTLIPMLATSLG